LAVDPLTKTLVHNHGVLSVLHSLGRQLIPVRFLQHLSICLYVLFRLKILSLERDFELTAVTVHREQNRKNMPQNY